MPYLHGNVNDATTIDNVSCRTFFATCRLMMPQWCHCRVNAVPVSNGAPQRMRGKFASCIYCNHVRIPKPSQVVNFQQRFAIVIVCWCVYDNNCNHGYDYDCDSSYDHDSDHNSTTIAITTRRARSYGSQVRCRCGAILFALLVLWTLLSYGSDIALDRWESEAPLVALTASGVLCVNIMPAAWLAWKQESRHRRDRVQTCAY